MKHQLLQALLVLLIFAPEASKAQRLAQLMSAQEYNQIKSGPEKSQQIRDLEHRSWVHKDAFIDQKGNALEAEKVDLSPFVDNLGETTFLVTDITPEFPGGAIALKDYLQNLLGDLLARSTDEVQNTLFIKFTVLKDGKIEAVEPANPFLDWIPISVTQRCMAALRDMPAWTPGIFKEDPVRVKLLMTLSLRK
jgi:hypothetical protein